MKRDEINRILSQIEEPIEDPRFSSRVFLNISKILRKQRDQKGGDPINVILSEDYGELSDRVDKSEIQESCSVRNVLKVRELANIVIDEEGGINLDLLPKIIEVLKKNLYFLPKNFQHDAKRNEHLIQVLMLLLENKQLVRQLKAIGKPHQHAVAEKIIRDTLELPPRTVVTDAHARRAAFSAWGCYLRQNVGSCFATAPAILVQKEQPSLFLKDIQELLSTGRLKRTFGGVEYAAPLSFSWGAGDLRRAFWFKRDEFEEIPIWKSPSMIEAFEKVGLIDPANTSKQKVMACKKMILNALKSMETHKPWFFASIESILRKVLLDRLGITEEDVRAYEMRPKGMIHGGLMITTAANGKDGTGKKCAQFLEEFNLAKDTFKELADNALLKTWEFTLASFAETKAQFTTWNLYTSLGLKASDKGGIGPKLYEILKQKLDYCNAKVNDLQIDYEQAYNHIQHLKRRIRHATSEEEARYIKIEYQIKTHEFYSLEEMRDRFSNKARRYANLYDGLIDLYFRLFPDYFQEVYDADILEVAVGPYDDSPAGFRLLYKHGRSNTSQWNRIQNHTDFVEALVSFFTSTEREITSAPEMKGLEDDVGEIISAIVAHVRSIEFLETAFWRMAAQHNAPLIKDPLDNLDKIEIKPWVYTSGGALTTLVSCYFRLEGKLSENARWVENPMELLVFLIDSVKEMPEKDVDLFFENPEKSLLIHSPTHAFLLKPGYPRFAEAVKAKEFTYTWVRDNVVIPMERFVDKIYLDEENVQFVAAYLESQVPKNFQHYFRQTFQKMGGSMKATDWRQFIVDTIDLSPGLQYGGRGVLSADQIDRALYTLLPLFPSYQLEERVDAILSHLANIEESAKKKMLELLKDVSGRIGSPKIISAEGLQNIVKSLIALSSLKLSAMHDYPLLICRAAQEEGFAMPTPFIFADTNWVKDYFAFLVNPGSGKLEMWRVDYTGSQGAPMSMWKSWLDGSKRKPDWGVFNRPHEYSFG